MRPANVGDNGFRKAHVVDASFFGARLVAAVGPGTFESLWVGHDEVLVIGECIQGADPLHLFRGASAAMERQDERSVRRCRNVEQILPHTILEGERDTTRALVRLDAETTGRESLKAEVAIARACSQHGCSDRERADTSGSHRASTQYPTEFGVAPDEEQNCCYEREHGHFTPARPP